MTRMRSFFLAATAALAASAAIIPAQAQDIVIGLSMVKTGALKNVGEATETAVNIAVDEINAEGGIAGKKIKLIKFDTGGDPKQAAIATAKFAEDDKALAIVGPFSSGEAAVAFPAGERLGIVQMPNAASQPGLTKLQLRLAAHRRRRQAVHAPHQDPEEKIDQDPTMRKSSISLTSVFPTFRERKFLPGDLQGQWHLVRRSDCVPVQHLRCLAASISGVGAQA